MSDVLEILAPAGDLHTLKVAIDNGADAVYLGASKFSARANATNFSLDELKCAVEYAHIFGAKVYLTINTIIKNNEMQDCLKLVKSAVDIGVDAFLVQDMGLASLLLANFKGIQLHASTQLGVHNLKGAKVLEQLGFSRVVLSREATLQDIKDIKNGTDLEIEYFVQGALCVGFSGNCYFSSICTSCSGNRGKCKQFCRLPYTAFEGDKQIKQGYLLSPSDQNLSSRMQELIDAGVNSFKIEGRLKKPSYVASSVLLFKSALNGEDLKQKQQVLKQVFSRGEFNTGKYLDGQNDNIINTVFNNHTGKKIGRVVDVCKFKDIYKIQIESKHSITKGDALKFYVANKEIGSMGVGNVEILKNGNFVVYSKLKPQVNCDVNLIVDARLEEKLLSKTRKLACDFQFESKIGKPAKLTVSCNGQQATVCTDQAISQAKTSALCYEDLKTNLSKLNNTVFVLNKLTADFEEVFIPKSVINDLRRNAINELTNQMLSGKKPKVEFVKTDFAEQKINAQQSYILTDNANNIANKEMTYIFSPNEFSQKEIEGAVEQSKLIGAKLYIDMPIVARHNDLKLIDDIILKFNRDDFGLVANNIYVFDYIDKFDIIAGLGLNIVNKYSKSFYLSLGAKDIIYSVEANINDVDENGVVYTKGNPVLMTLTHCPFKMLFNNTCNNCTYKHNLIYKMQDGRTLKIRRKKIASCYFEVVDSVVIDNKKSHNKRTFVDARKPFKTDVKTTVGMIDKSI